MVLAVFSRDAASVSRAGVDSAKFLARRAGLHSRRKGRISNATLLTDAPTSFNTGNSRIYESGPSHREGSGRGVQNLLRTPAGGEVALTEYPQDGHLQNVRTADILESA